MQRQGMTRKHMQRKDMAWNDMPWEGITLAWKWDGMERNGNSWNEKESHGMLRH
jgi:hypothetical protein